MSPIIVPNFLVSQAWGVMNTVNVFAKFGMTPITVLESSDVDLLHRW